MHAHGLGAAAPIPSAAWVIGLVGATSACLPQNELAPRQAQSSVDERIVGGLPTNAYPAVGALVDAAGTHCTATLIGPKKLLTAAHCIDDARPRELDFILGINTNAPEATLDVAALEPHPGFDGYAIQDDIGLVHLSEAAPIQPMQLVASMDGSWRGRQLTFVGYGSSGAEDTSGTKRAVAIPVDSVHATTFSYAYPGRNTCAGDSGGPALAQTTSGKHVVVGVTSFGDAECQEFGINTRVDAYTEFLGVAQAAVAGPGDCGRLGYAGRCDGDVVEWCDGGQLQQQDCAAEGFRCGWSDDYGYFGCLRPQEPCNGETYAGRCDEETLIWCENDEVQRVDCAGKGLWCGWASAKGFYDCLNRP